jgi:SAM-dependent methyltransferase
VRKPKLLSFAYRWSSPFINPLRAARAMRSLVWYVGDYRRYRKMDGAGDVRLVDSMPALHERTAMHELDAHYFYVNSWAMRHLARVKPVLHVDVGSQVLFSALGGAFIPTVFVDYRAFPAGLVGTLPMSADILRLPFRDGSIASLSCLHVAEHIGLGRYGDPLDPRGTERAGAELSRVLAPDGSLYFALPIGRERVDFNAHRVHSGKTIRAFFQDLELVEFSGVDDEGVFHSQLPVDALDGEEYGCGFFWLRRPS